MPDRPAVQRSCSVRAPLLRRDRSDARDHRAAAHDSLDIVEVHRLPDGLQPLHVLGGQLDAVLVLHDLRQLDEVERVDLEGRELGVGADLVGVGAELLERLKDALLELLLVTVAGIRFLLSLYAVNPPSTVSMIPVT